MWRGPRNATRIEHSGSLARLPGAIKGVWSPSASTVADNPGSRGVADWDLSKRRLRLRERREREGRYYVTPYITLDAGNATPSERHGRSSLGLEHAHSWLPGTGRRWLAGCCSKGQRRQETGWPPAIWMNLKRSRLVGGGGMRIYTA